MWHSIKNQYWKNQWDTSWVSTKNRSASERSGVITWYVRRRVINAPLQQPCNQENNSFSSTSTTVTFSTCALPISAANITRKRREAIWRPVASERMTERQAIKPAVRHGGRGWTGWDALVSVSALPPARHRGTGARCAPSITYLRVRQPQSFLATHLVALPAGTIAVSCVSAGSLQRPNNGHIVHHSHQRRSLRTVHPLPQSYVIHAPCCSVYDACGQNVSYVNLIILTSHCMQATATVYSWIKMLSGYQPHHHFVITRSMIWTCKFLASKHLKTEEIRIYCELQYKTV